MKKLIYLIIIIMATASVQFGCQKDPLSDVNGGGWNNERSILDIKFNNQVGKAKITRVDDTNGTITLAINTGAVPNLSAITIGTMELSFGASSSAKVGDKLNFENDTRSANIMVHSPTGKSRTYVITVTPFTETLIGTYNITGLYVYGGTGPEYGGGAVLKMSDKPWCWPANEGPDKEEDNSLTFELTGITDDGNTYGKVTNNAGDDGLFANFLFISKTPNIDVNHFYRTIPKGEGKWLRNYSTGLITFTFADGTTTSGTFAGSGNEDLGNDLSRTITNNAFEFILNGTDDWTNIYSDFDKFVQRPRKFWIDVTKR